MVLAIEISTWSGYIFMFGKLCLFNNKRKICLEFSLGKNPSIYFSLFLENFKKHSRVNSDCITGNLPYLPPLFWLQLLLSCPVYMYKRQGSPVRLKH